MSTFDGVIREIPGVRVDYFRHVVDQPPLACFLSHVHSDHLAGLETFKGCFVYCSAATRAILLKMQRRASRVNFAQRILEAEELTYKHHKNRLKPLPLDTPTKIELGPTDHVHVTLLDANHCPGAVMFLFEGHGKAVLYTGDIRSEPWHVNALSRNPCMLQYTLDTSGRQSKVLDKIYLDTSFTEGVSFQTKADGLRELLAKVAKYPQETHFYFSAWTYGYEDVWIALAKALNTQIHVDEYKMKIYESLRVKFDDQWHYLSSEAPALVGFPCANRTQPGLLTRDPEVRLHSCEKGSGCPTMQRIPTENIVWITPIVAHLQQEDDLVEVGIGGGAEDLEERDHVVLTVEDLREWLETFRKEQVTPERTKILDFLRTAISAQQPLELTLHQPETDDLDELHVVYQSLRAAAVEDRGYRSSVPLPNKIQFPYSRHSSYNEVCHLLSIFKPKDVWPCTVNKLRWIRQGITIESLFGSCCSGDIFDHDEYMMEEARRLRIKDADQDESHNHVETSTQSSSALGLSSSVAESSSLSVRGESAIIGGFNHGEPLTSMTATAQGDNDRDGGEKQKVDDSANRQHKDINGAVEARGDCQGSAVSPVQEGVRKRKFEVLFEMVEPHAIHRTDNDVDNQLVDEADSQDSSLSARALEARRNAFMSMSWEPNDVPWPGLLCTTNNHTYVEVDLGEDQDAPGTDS